MESLLMFMTSIILVVLAFVLLWCGVKVFHTIWLKPKYLEKLLKQQGIKGTPYKILYGDRNEYFTSMQEARSKPMNLTHCIIPRVTPFDIQILQTYGKISMFWFGTTPRVIIWDADMMREILSNKFGHFRKPPVNPLIELLTMGLSMLENDKWVKHRRIMNPAFHQEKLKEMSAGFMTSCTKLIERLNSLVGLGGSGEVDVWPELQTFTGDVISRSAFGSTFEEGKKIFELQKVQALLAIEASQSVYFPGLRYIPTTKNKRRMKVDKEIKSLFKELIDKKEQAMRNGESSSDDLLGLLLQCNNREGNVTNSRSIVRMTTEEVIEECKLFNFAGQETTSTWLTWTMIVLSMHQDWQEKAREEVLRVCGRHPPKLEAINQLKIVNMILYEVLRLYPPVVQLLRHTYKNIKVGDIEFPAGVQIMLPTLLIHHDPELWGNDAEEFKPERFAEGISKATVNEKAAFYPFGWGPRICIGQNFAILEAKMALVTILQNFSFELSPSYTHAPHTVLTLQPQHGAQVILHRL